MRPRRRRPRRRKCHDLGRQLVTATVKFFATSGNTQTTCISRIPWSTQNLIASDWALKTRALRRFQVHPPP